MSLRPPVDRARILAFLEALGRRFRKPGRLYLVGGATIILEGLRAKTVDIDFTCELSPGDHGLLIDSVRALKEELDVNVEEVSPADFIPLPEGWRERCLFVGRYGALDVFHFDLYSTALSKIERGLESDFEDVEGLLRSGHLDMGRLEAYFRAILPRFGKESLKQDPRDFEAKFRALKARRAAGPPTSA
jgi:hypothetical protein